MKAGKKKKNRTKTGAFLANIGLALILVMVTKISYLYLPPSVYVQTFTAACGIAVFCTSSYKWLEWDPGMPADPCKEAVRRSGPWGAGLCLYIMLTALYMEVPEDIKAQVFGKALAYFLISVIRLTGDPQYIF
jgi:hypothetical protein